MPSAILAPARPPLGHPLDAFRRLNPRTSARCPVCLRRFDDGCLCDSTIRYRADCRHSSSRRVVRKVRRLALVGSLLSASNRLARRIHSPAVGPKPAVLPCGSSWCSGSRSPASAHSGHCTTVGENGARPGSTHGPTISPLGSDRWPGRTRTSGQTPASAQRRFSSPRSRVGAGGQQREVT